MLGNEADALDATQDALVAAIRAMGRFDGRSSFGTWIYRIATNTCIDEMRRRGRRPVTGTAADIADVADEASLGAPGLFVVPTRRAPGPSETAVDGEEGWQRPAQGGAGARRTVGSFGGTGGGPDPADIVADRVDIDAALASLPVEFRTALVLRDVSDLPYDEIAEILGVPVGTVRSRIARARAALAATWQDEATGRDRSSPRPVHVTGNHSDSAGVRTSQDELPVTEPSRPSKSRPRRPDQGDQQSQEEQHTP